MKQKKYQAAGGVVIHRGKILILDRPTRNEIRLPKGHIDPGETAQQTALREIQEESGISGIDIICSLGTQIVEIHNFKPHLIRTEHFYLMKSNQNFHEGKPEEQFVPMWLSPDEAIKKLTFENEKEWVRRAIEMLNQKDG